MILTQKILTIVQLMRLHPTDLMGALRGDYSYTEKQDALVQLMHENLLVLSSDHYLETPVIYEPKTTTE